MTRIDNNSFKEALDNILNKSRIAVILSGRLNCINCQLTKANILNYLKKNPKTNIDFLYLNGSIDDILESSYYQMEELNEYPKTAIFSSSNNPTFKEGIITEEDLSKIEQLKKNCL